MNDVKSTGHFFDAARYNPIVVQVCLNCEKEKCKGGRYGCREYRKALSIARHREDDDHAEQADTGTVCEGAEVH